jgi:hypothetical protein
MMLERDVERRLKRGIDRLGGLCLKWVSPGKAGVPDRIVILRGPTIWFVELNTERGKLTPLQAAMQQSLRALGCNVVTLYGPADVDRFVASLDIL